MSVLAWDAPRNKTKQSRVAAHLRRRPEAASEILENVGAGHRRVRPVARVARDKLVRQASPGQDVERLEPQEIVPLPLGGQMHDVLQFQQQDLDQGAADLIVQQSRGLWKQPSPIVALDRTAACVLLASSVLLVNGCV
eukprot:scaffold501_cov355-Pinguiococcus_pyrenoidosus.AAC.19